MLKITEGQNISSKCIFHRIKMRPNTIHDESTGRTSPQVIAAVLCLAPLLTLGQPAMAVDATWSATPSDGDFNNDANWVGGVEPDGTATFGSSTETDLSITSSTTIGGFTFDDGAYTFAQNQQLQFTGAGITVNGGSVAITDNHIMNFLNASTAGDAAITNNGTVTIRQHRHGRQRDDRQQFQRGFSGTEHGRRRDDHQRWYCCLPWFEHGRHRRYRQ